ncbi:translation initiation factor [Rhodococcus hoagii]|nr:translation initiation factor [Prescottella equi]NKZ89236.1 translation initiation factor [Prescottella equi]
MPPRSRSGAGSATPEHLTAENLETLAAAVAEGKRATVYLREATPSLGIEAGCSAKVVSVEGNTVVISPKGVNDELPFEAEELRMTRKAPEPVKPTRPAKAAAPAPKPAAAPAPKPAAAPAPKPVSAPKPAPAPAAVTSTAPQAPPAPAPRRAKKAPAGVSVTIHAGAENDWTVTVTHGAKRPGKATPVSPDAVDRAMRELGDDVALEAVQSVISAAREAAEQRIAALSKELEDARRALEALGSTS